jgi:hypothetical protein
VIYSAIKGDVDEEGIFTTVAQIDGAIDLCLASLEKEGYSDLNVNVRVANGVYYVVAFPVENGEPIGRKIQTFAEQMTDLRPEKPFDQG